MGRTVSPYLEQRLRSLDEVLRSRSCEQHGRDEQGGAPAVGCGDASEEGGIEEPQGA